jgi:ribosome biogenesis GTPase
MAEEREGTVIRVEGASCRVKLDAPPGDVVRAGMRRSLRFAGEGDGVAHAIAVGDRVRLDEAGSIATVLERKSKLVRRAPEAHDRGARRREHVVAANVDQLAIVVAACDPEWRPGFVDRLLVAAEKGALSPLVVVNKVDLAKKRARAALGSALEVYRRLGYRALETSATDGEGVDALREAFRDRTTVLAGPSGAGKSSLVNAIEPGLHLATGEVSRATGKGRHTTTAASLLPLAQGGFVVDTPGVREFGFFDVGAAELAPLFRDFAPFLGRCRFPDCTHTVEPDCAVRAAAEAGEIAPGRYESYLRIRESLPERAALGPGPRGPRRPAPDEDP